MIKFQLTRQSSYLPHGTNLHHLQPIAFCVLLYRSTHRSWTNMNWETSQIGHQSDPSTNQVILEIYIYEKYIHHYSSQWSKCQPSCSIKKQTYHAHQKVMRVLASQLHEFDKQHLQTLHVINLNPHLETHIRVIGASCSPAYCDLRCCSWTLKVISTMTRRYYWTIPAVPECRDCRIFATCPLSLSRVVPRSVRRFFQCVCVCGSSL